MEWRLQIKAVQGSFNREKHKFESKFSGDLARTNVRREQRKLWNGDK